MKILVTGSAGFVGFHVAKALLQRGDEVVGFDVVNSYYDPTLKEARLRILEADSRKTNGAYTFHPGRPCRHGCGRRLFRRAPLRSRHPSRGPSRSSPQHHHPHDYVQSNLVAFTNILEACRHSGTPHLTYASTSSVYGANTQMPFSEHHGVNHPLQFYAATKRANELMAHAYSHMFAAAHDGTAVLHGLWALGPAGHGAVPCSPRTSSEGKPITVFNYGKHTRDFTYVDDIAEGVIR